MDGHESTLFCGVERLEIDIGGAVAVALDVFVDLILNDRSKHGAILHIPVYLQRFLHKTHHHFGFCEALRFGHGQNFRFGGKGARPANLERFAAFLSRGVLGGYPPADWRVAVLFWRIQSVQLRIEADLRTHQSALADIYLALPPRWLLPS